MNFLLITFLFFSSILWAAEEGPPRNLNLGLRVHKYTYLMPYSYIDHGRYADEHSELKYQFSFCIPTIGRKNMTTLFLAYTQKSHWQVYDTSNSKPFRNTDYNPEIFVQTKGQNFNIDFGYEHESNGESDPKSRSWDRLFTRVNFFSHYLSGYLKGWYILSEDQGRQDIAEKRQKIVKFYGYGEMRLVLKFGMLHLSSTGRYNFSTKKGFVQNDITWPLCGPTYLHLLYSRGYGDNLLDYNMNVSRYGIGIMLKRW